MPTFLRVVAILLALTVLPISSLSAAIVTVDFGTGGFETLPFSQSGFNFSRLSGGAFVSGPMSDRDLTVNLPAASTMSQVRIESNPAFDLLSFQVETTPGRDWEVFSSAGGLLVLPGGSAPGRIDLPRTNDWRNLTFVDVRHTLGEANAIIRLDDFVFQTPTAVPEPSSSAACLIAAACMSGWLRRKMRNSPIVQ